MEGGTDRDAAPARYVLGDRRAWCLVRVPTVIEEHARHFSLTLGGVEARPACDPSWLRLPARTHAFFTTKLLLEDERHLHVHAVLDDLALVHDDLLILNPGACNVTQRLVGAGHSAFDCLLETFR